MFLDLNVGPAGLFYPRKEFFVVIFVGTVEDVMHIGS